MVMVREYSDITSPLDSRKSLRHFHQPELRGNVKVFGITYRLSCLTKMESAHGNLKSTTVRTL